MNIVHISTYDIRGGAARAAYRLHQGLLRLGEDSRMLVRHKGSTDDSVYSMTPKGAAEELDEELFLSTVIQGHYINSHRTGGRPSGQEDITAHELKGVAGDWRNYVSERVKQAFKARYGDLLVASGYALDLGW